ncbi:MAG: hypothetical protein A2Z12_08580 [Actinobacteria bacterium RBG_16_68_21]|nr:MAG: hypothetical protein A2Z12_08580 [Actinobacteria bacterium RBG_16_68_21]
MSDWQEFRVRAGTVVRAEPNTGARDPAYCLWIDFGPLGELQSSAKVTDRYAAGELVGTQVIAITGFEPIRVGGFRSDVLVLGVLTDRGVVLLRPDQPVAAGDEVA